MEERTAYLREHPFYKVAVESMHGLLTASASAERMQSQLEHICDTFARLLRNYEREQA